MVDWPLSTQFVSLPFRLRHQPARSLLQSTSLPFLTSPFPTKTLNSRTIARFMAMFELPQVAYELRPSSQLINFVFISTKFPGVLFPLPVRILLHRHFLVSLVCFCLLN